MKRAATRTPNTTFSLISRRSTVREIASGLSNRFGADVILLPTPPMLLSTIDNEYIDSRQLYVDNR